MMQNPPISMKGVDTIFVGNKSYPLIPKYFEIKMSTSIFILLMGYILSSSILNTVHNLK